AEGTGRLPRSASGVGAFEYAWASAAVFVGHLRGAHQTQGTGDPASAESDAGTSPGAATSPELRRPRGIASACGSSLADGVKPPQAGTDRLVARSQSPLRSVALLPLERRIGQSTLSVCRGIPSI